MENINFRQNYSLAIKTTGLTKAFGTLIAVNKLDLEVRRGDVFGFLGPNGSGKTTTIRMLLGLMRPTAGNAYIFEMNIATHLPLILRHLGAIVETPIFYPYLSGADNLRTIAAASGMHLGKASQHRIDEVLEIIDLQQQANDAYRQYSLGMKQRLGIGAALLTDPELVLLDEPTNGLDPAGVHEMRQLIMRLAALGKTIFISSHILHEIQQVCNRLAIMKKGKLIKQGSVKELLHEGNQVVIRLGSDYETQQALAILKQAMQHDMSWIKQVQIGEDTQKRAVLYVDAPDTRSAEIAAILAKHSFFAVEMYAYQSNLEDLFLELTASPSEEEKHVYGSVNKA